MIGKILLTLMVLAGAYGVLRARWRAERVARGQEPPRPPLVPPGAMRLTASVLIALMAVGSSLAILQRWLDDQEIVQVQVVNANTGQITTYRAHRGDVEGRRLETLDGRQVRLADVERMIVLPEDEADRP